MEHKVKKILIATTLLISLTNEVLAFTCSELEANPEKFSEVDKVWCNPNIPLEEKANEAMKIINGQLEANRLAESEGWKKLKDNEELNRVMEEALQRAYGKTN